MALEYGRPSYQTNGDLTSSTASSHGTNLAVYTYRIRQSLVPQIRTPSETPLTASNNPLRMSPPPVSILGIELDRGVDPGRID